MSAAEPTSAPSAQRPTKRRIRGHRRALTIASLALALLGGAIGQAGTAAASPPPGYCTQTCNQAPAGISNADWNAALEAANFWSTERIDFAGRGVWSDQNYVQRLIWRGRAPGWPSRHDGGHW